MNLLLVGGAGFIGLNYFSALLSKTLAGVSNIVLLDAFTYASHEDTARKLATDFDIQILELDIRDREGVLAIGTRFDLILNFAAESHVDRSIIDPTSFVYSNVLGVQNLLDLSMKNSARFLQVSTDEVYGSIEEGSWDEEFPILPNSPYAATKAAADLLVRSYIKTHKLDAVVTRSCNNFGPFQHSEKFIPTVITHLMTERKVPIYGNGRNSREWVFVEDNIRGIHNALLIGKSGETYNLGSGHEYTNVELFNKICQLGHFDSNLFHFVPDRKGHDSRYSLNFEKARIELGYEPTLDFELNLTKTIDWYKAQEVLDLSN